MKPLPYILALFILTGCGTRKAALDLRKVKSESRSETEIEVKNAIVTNARMSRVANTLILTPIDSEKKSIYTSPEGETTTFQNTTLEFGTVLANTHITEEDDSTLDLEKKKEEKISVKDKQKETESDKGNPWFWVGFFVFLGTLGYLVYRRLVR